MGWKLVKTPSAQLYDLPIIGDDIANIGRIIDLYATPCSPDPKLWVYGFFKALPTAAISLTKPELIDINIKHRGRKPRKGRKYRFKASDLLRDAIVEVPVPRWVPFTLYEWGQRIGWYFLVADVAEEFLINWQSLAYRYNGCQSPDWAYCYASTTNTPNGGILNNLVIIRWNNPAPRSQVGWTGSYAYLLVPGKYRVTWNVTFDKWSHPTELPIRTICFVNGEVLSVGETSTENPTDGKNFSSGSSIIEFDGSGRPQIYIAAEFTQELIRFTATGVFSVDRISDLDLSPDP